MRSPAVEDRSDAPDAGTRVAGRSTRSSWLRDAAIVIGGLLIGLALPLSGRIIDGIRDDDRGAAPPAASSIDTDGAASAQATDELVGADVEPTPAGTPVDAVRLLLEAEISGDHGRSFGLLAESNRASYGSVAAWRAAHADFFPVVAFEVTGERSAGDVVEVVTDVSFRSSIDEVVGLVPARAEMVWPVVDERGGWLVDFDGAEVTPRFPPDADALRAVHDWASTRQACERATEYSAGLVGVGSFADRLCGSQGRIVVGSTVESLDPADAAPFVSAFGPDAETWARTVSLRGPVPLIVVVVPVDDRWLVVGVVEPR